MSPDIHYKKQIMVKIRTTLLLVLLAAITAHSQTYITGGEVTGNWTPEGNPYIIEGDMIVAPDERLNIDAGVEILFTGPYVIEIYGRIEALGTPNDSIYFGVQDTTGFSGDSYNGWYGIGFVGYGSITSEMSRFEYCNIEFSAGSGITCMNYPNFEIKHTRIASNKEYGLSLMEFSDIQASDLLIENNGAGGISTSFATPQITSFEIRNNSGTGISINGNSSGSNPSSYSNGLIYQNESPSNGGGIKIGEDAMVDLEDVQIYNNQAANGGGIFSSSGYVTLNNMMISFNQAGQGGGLYAEGSSYLIFSFATISHNVASGSGGGAYNYDGNITMTRSTVADNMAAENGGGFYFELYETGQNVINSSIIWNNGPDAISSPLVQPEIAYSDVEGGYEGSGNIDHDPLFAQSENNDYNLTWVNYPFENAYTSPCIDHGDPAIEEDPDGTIADMGAYYYHQQMFMTRVNENQWGSSVDIYPNPANSTVFFSGTEDISVIEIANLNGQLVKRFERLNTGTAMEISDLQPGIYLVMLQDNTGNSTTKKLIKQ